MEGKPTKRARAPNFSSYENSVLVDLIEKHKAVIENKQTDGVTLKQKEESWRRLSVEFNSVPGVTQRNAGNLKTAYENIKRRARRASANEKVELYRTGGGPVPPSKIDEVEKRVLGIISSKTTCLVSPHDSDAGYGVIAESDQSRDGNTSQGALDVLDDIAIGEYVVTAYESDDDCDGSSGRGGQIREQQSPEATPTSTYSKHPLVNTQRKRKHTATEAIRSTAELHRQSIEKDLLHKEDMHRLERRVKSEELALLETNRAIAETKRAIADEKLKYWRNKNKTV